MLVQHFSTIVNSLNILKIEQMQSAHCAGLTLSSQDHVPICHKPSVKFSLLSLIQFARTDTSEHFIL